MKRKSLKLKDLRVKSFLTQEPIQHMEAAKGGNPQSGAAGGTQCNTIMCNTLQQQCTENVACESLGGVLYHCLGGPTEGSPTEGQGN